MTSEELLHSWLLNTELECSGASLCAIEKIAIGGDVLELADLLTVLRQASADRDAVAELVELLRDLDAWLKGGMNADGKELQARADAILSRHQAGLGKGDGRG
jgi:hypothetical protein